MSEIEKTEDLREAVAHCVNGWARENVDGMLCPRMALSVLLSHAGAIIESSPDMQARGQMLHEAIAELVSGADAPFVVQLVPIRDVEATLATAQPAGRA